MDKIMGFVSSFSSNWALSIEKAIKKQKLALFKTKEQIDAEQQGNIIKTLWNWIIVAMVVYFVVTFLNQLVRNQLQTEWEQKKVARHSEQKLKEFSPSKT